MPITRENLKNNLRDTGIGGKVNVEKLVIKLVVDYSSKVGKEEKRKPRKEKQEEIKEKQEERKEKRNVKNKIGKFIFLKRYFVIFF